jgi:hypothetical protein
MAVFVSEELVFHKPSAGRCRRYDEPSASMAIELHQPPRLRRVCRSWPPPSGEHRPDESFSGFLHAWAATIGRRCVAVLCKKRRAEVAGSLKQGFQHCRMGDRRLEDMRQARGGAGGRTTLEGSAAIPVEPFREDSRLSFSVGQ